ncbi:MAG: TonB-dependent receptor plug domain-containing protein [Bacteroidetes bacterium]|nr:TonB-dependent receptor plug domain-containing protein [Bacteroidota bacterium]
MISRYHLFFYFILRHCFYLAAQDTTTQIFTPLINEVIGINTSDQTADKVKITNLNSVKINEAPGSVYVITSEDIQKNGYRDLIDVFMDIPGFNIASDVQNGTGISLRGAWAAEAKLLVMIDGLIMNDMSYGSFVLGGRIPLLNVDRIEVIRGASSSIYGGIAGLGVVNIITKEGNYSKASTFQLDAGFSGDEFSGTRLTFSNTSYLLNDFELSLSGSIYQGNKSNQQYTHPDSMYTDFSDSSEVGNTYLQMKLRRKEFEYKVLYDDYSFQATHEGIYSLCRTFINDFSYDKKIGKFHLYSSANLKEQIPWNTQYGDPVVYDIQNLKTRRISLSVNMTYALNDRLSFLLGGSYYNDYMRCYRPFLALNTGNTSENYNAAAGFGEVTFKTKFFHLFAGGRLDYYESFKPNFAPRLSLTKEFKSFHYKLIYGQSFKIPTLQNINLAITNTEPIKPEHIKDYQVELGVKLKKHTLNLGGFYTSIDDIIVYGYDLTTFTESYVNNGNITLGGAELFTTHDFNKLTLRAGYSYYELLNSDGTDFMADTSSLKAGTLAIPKHKLTTRFNFAISDKNHLILNYTFQSSKIAVEQTNAALEEYNFIKHTPTHLLDLTFQSNALFGFIDVNLGVRNVLNTYNLYLYPMNSGYPTSMGMGREFFILLKVNL